MKHTKILLLNILMFLLIIACQTTPDSAMDWNQFRGPNRDGKSAETGLLKQWPENGPEVLWTVEGIGDGYSTAIISNGIIYTTGMIDSLDYVTAIDRKGNIKWKAEYGKSWRESWPGVRISPTIEDGKMYVISGEGELSCLNAKNGEKIWTKDAYTKFEGKYRLWGIAENLLLVDKKVIYTPGGDKTTMVALDKNTGETLWMSETLEDFTAYVSPILIHHGGRKIVSNITAHYFIGVDAENGDFIWTYNYGELNAPTFHPEAPVINCVMPIYHDGQIFITSGYNHTGALFNLLPDGSGVELAWQDTTLDCHHGGVIHVDGYLYGANWEDNRNGNWVCQDWKTGKVMYEKKWVTKGSILYADGMLYCYEEKSGNVALVKATPEDFEIISSFEVTSGRGPHWAHPVIHNGVLYIRHGDTLTAYNVKQ